ncbi:PspA-associated protein PspAA [Nocardioides jensenii]|uniref:PspA-associated protein PspAA n=1 Tax=Nocardioides jensenii TaxID=1843 RepID=UPI00083170A9|nr:F0F1 ATP synthase [Nocardioides jensenii]
MIVRILGEGQYDVADGAVDRLNTLDAQVESAVEADDTDAFTAALGELLDVVRSVGVPHDAEAIDVSDVVLPPSDATLDEVRELLSDDGLIPG